MMKGLKRVRKLLKEKFPPEQRHGQPARRKKKVLTHAEVEKIRQAEKDLEAFERENEEDTFQYSPEGLKEQQRMPQMRIFGMKWEGKRKPTAERMRKGSERLKKGGGSWMMSHSASRENTRKALRTKRPQESSQDISSLSLRWWSQKGSCQGSWGGGWISRMLQSFDKTNGFQERKSGRLGGCWNCPFQRQGFTLDRERSFKGGHLKEREEWPSCFWKSLEKLWWWMKNLQKEHGEEWRCLWTLPASLDEWRKSKQAMCSWKIRSFRCQWHASVPRRSWLRRKKNGRSTGRSRSKEVQSSQFDRSSWWGSSRMHTDWRRHQGFGTYVLWNCFKRLACWRFRLVGVSS